MKRFVTVCLLLFAASALPAQTVRVLDESGAVLDNATIEIVETNTETHIETHGHEPSGITTVLVSAPGHYPIPHSFKTADGLGHDVRLVARRPGRRLLLFAGDAMLARRYAEPLAGEPVLVRDASVLADAEALLAPVRPYIEQAELASVNLETPLSAAPLRDPLPKLVTFYSPPELAVAFERAGFDYVALGNNHSYDFGEAGIAATLDVLGQTGLGYSGAGHDSESARAPYVTTLSNRDLAFLSYVGWLGTFTPNQVAEAGKGGAAYGTVAAFAEDLAGLGDETIAVLQQHAGLEYAAEPALSERTSLRQAVDHGADLVIAHHAHVLQGLEVYRERLIAYSMGNFLFDQYHYTTQLGMLLYVWMDDDRFHRAEIVPLNIQGYAPTPATGAFADAVLERVARTSAPLGTCMQPSGAHAFVVATGNAGSCASDTVSLSGLPPATPVALSSLGATSVAPVRALADGQAYRVGTDLLRRGDFESFLNFGHADRSWTGLDTAVTASGNRVAALRLEPGRTQRAGMRVFERVFKLSSPATFSARVRATADTTLRVSLQRRRPSERLSDAFGNDAVLPLGEVLIEAGDDWVPVVFDFNHPRLATRSLRLLLDLESAAGANVAADVQLDDLTWVQWATPWQTEGPPAFGTHIQLQPERTELVP